MNEKVAKLEASRPGMDRVVGRRTNRLARRRVVGVLAVVLLLAALAALYRFFLPGGSTLAVDGDQVRVETAQRRPFIDYLPLRAEAQPLSSVVVTSPAGGQVREILVADGAPVAAGQPIARLTNQQLELTIASQQVEIASRLADVTGQEQALQRNRLDMASQVALANNERIRAEHELAGRERLYSRGLISDSGIMLFRSDAAFRRAQVASLSRGQAAERAVLARQLAQLQQTSALLRRNLGALQATLGSLLLKAPIAGTLTGFTRQLGQTVAPGEAIGQVSQSGGAYKIVGGIDEFYLGRVAAGQTATGVVDGRTFSLIVARVLPQVTAGRFSVELNFTGHSRPTLRRGQAVDVRLSLGSASPAIVVPAGPWAEARGTVFVAPAGESRRFERRLVQIGRRTPEQVEILSGIAAGERVIVSPTASYVGLASVELR